MENRNETCSRSVTKRGTESLCGVAAGIQTLAEEPDALRKQKGSRRQRWEVQAPSAVLMEASTGAVLYEKDADTRRAPGQCHEDHD